MTKSGIVWAVIIILLYLVTGFVTVFYFDFIVSHLKTIIFIIVALLGFLMSLLSFLMLLISVSKR